jgi:sulfide dehydrogenase cytochrome subunit
MPLLDEHRLAQFCVFFCGAILFCTLAFADVTDIAGECDRCHGADGVSAESDVPSIAGISSFILEEYIFEYQDDARACRESKYRSGDLDQPATDMCVVANDLSESDVAAIAEFYGNKEFTSAEQEFDAQKAALGAKVHKKLCEKCHADGGSYADDDASILAGQWMPYLEQALADQVSGERTMLDEKMREKTDQLSEDDVELLIHFYGSQQ